MIEARFKLLTPTAQLPVFGDNNDTNVGIDIFADEDILIPAKGDRLVKTGIAWSPVFVANSQESMIQEYIYCISRTHKIEMQLRSRSGLSTKHSVEVGAGTIDQEYIGEIKVHLYNFGNDSYKITRGDKIAQGIIDKKPKVQVVSVDTLAETKRGENGFGSTGR